MLIFDSGKIRKIARELGTSARSHRFVLAAFLVPLLIRSIPEILVGPYPIGWDTIAFYVPNTLDWAAGKAGFTEILGTAPLMYMISVPAYILTRVNPVWIFKIMGPILYGTMIWALFRFLKIGLKWPDKQALGGALLTSLYFVTLRISWDLYRNMLGLTFILLSLPLIEDMKGPRKQALFSMLIVFAVAADQLTGALALVLFGARAFGDLARLQRREFVRMVKVVLPGAVLFISITYAGLILTGIGLVRTQASVPTVGDATASLGFLAYAYLPLVPLILLGINSAPTPDLRNWLIFCVAVVAMALLPLFGPIVASYRWALLLDIPICIYAAAGLSRLAGATSLSISWMSGFHGKIIPIFSTILIVSTVLYIALPAQQAVTYYTAFPGMLPTSMVQDTIPGSDAGNLQQLLNSAAARMGPGTVLITHRAIYGWARAYLPSFLQDRLINYEYNGPLTGVEMAKSEGYTSMLMIWWINGSGWHNQPYVPSGFVSVFQDGDLVLYEFSQSAH
jgi:hypothetical protein